MNNPNKAELRRLCEDAKDLDWEFDWMDKRAHAVRQMATPANVLSLLDECESGEQWRNLALQFDMHRMQAMALIRMVASGAASSSQCYEFAARAPIPGHEITERLAKAEAERDAALAEIEACRKDAERLDWLTKKGAEEDPEQGDVRGYIDSAMSQEVGRG